MTPYERLVRAFKGRKPSRYTADTIIYDNIYSYPDTQTLTLVIWLSLRNADDIEKWVASIYDPDSPWYNKRPTRAELQAHFGRVPTDSQLIGVSAWLGTWSQVQVTSPLGDFIVVTTTIADFNSALETQVLTDGIHNLTRHLPQIPRQFRDVIVAFSWQGMGLIPTVTSVSKTETIPNYMAPHSNPATLHNNAVGDNNAVFSDLITMFGGGASFVGAGSVTTGLVYAGDYVDAGALDVLQSTEFPNSNNGNTWSSSCQFDLATADGTVVPFPAPTPPSQHSETDLDIQAALSAMASMVDPGVSINVVELVTDIFAPYEAGQVSFDVFKILPLEAILMLNTTPDAAGNFLPWVWSSSYGIDDLDAAYIRRLEQEQGLLSILGYTIVFASGDQGTALLYNGQSSNTAIQRVPLKVAGNFVPQHSRYVLTVGGAIPLLSDPTTLTVMDPATFTGRSMWFASGGGFSQYIRAPHWQKRLTHYYNKHTEAIPLGYDPKGRGVPDIAGPGVVNYIVDAQGDYRPVAGTSVSAPFVAGILAVAEWQRRVRGLPPGLGCINPLLYSQQGRQIMMRNIGGSNTNYLYPGFAVLSKDSKWDPAQGLGIFNATALIELLLGFPIPSPYKENRITRSPSKRPKHNARGRRVLSKYRGKGGRALSPITLPHGHQRKIHQTILLRKIEK